MGDWQVDGVVVVGGSIGGIGVLPTVACPLDALSQSVVSCSCDPFPTVTGCGCPFRAASGVLSPS